jgi:hypothetical protein
MTQNVISFGNDARGDDTFAHDSSSNLIDKTPRHILLVPADLISMFALPRQRTDLNAEDALLFRV